MIDKYLVDQVAEKITASEGLTNREVILLTGRKYKNSGQVLGILKALETFGYLAYQDQGKIKIYQKDPPPVVKQLKKSRDPGDHLIKAQ